jgi:hypothetical protein
MEFDLNDGIAVLERTPVTLRSMLDGLSPAWTDATEGADTWSPYVVIGHLIHGERTDWIPRAQIILAQVSRRARTARSRRTIASRNSARVRGSHCGICSMNSGSCAPPT